jgi:hypothetical protein
LLVKHHACVTQTADMDPCLLEILAPARQAVRGLTHFVVIALARDPTRQIEHVEFDRGMPQKMREVLEPFRIL